MPFFCFVYKLINSILLLYLLMFSTGLPIWPPKVSGSIQASDRREWIITKSSKNLGIMVLVLQLFRPIVYFQILGHQLFFENTAARSVVTSHRMFTTHPVASCFSTEAVNRWASRFLYYAWKSSARTEDFQEGLFMPPTTFFLAPTSEYSAPHTTTTWVPVRQNKLYLSFL